MKIVANMLLVLGVCFAAVGAAGFHNPAETGRVEESDRDTEPQAWPLFAFGMVIIGFGGALGRISRRRSRRGEDQHEYTTTETIGDLLRRITKQVVDLDDHKAAMSRKEICESIDALLNGDFFDLVDKREDFVQLVGFTDYAKVWDGVATAERQLARVWSIATDGFTGQAIQDLPVARRNLERAVEAMSLLGP